MSDKYDLVFVRTVKRRSPAVKKQLSYMRSRILGAGREGRGWRASVKLEEPKKCKAGYQYRAAFHVTCKPKRGRDPDSVAAEFENIQRIAQQAGNAYEWLASELNGEPFDEEAVDNKTVGYVPIEIPSDWRRHFNTIYERDDQINIVVSSLRAAIESDFQNRFHCALVGQPACGKTSILQCLKSMVGEASVLEYDATSTTHAGAIKDLKERDELPRILIVEEGEKTQEASLHWLLSALDQRAEIRKVTYREQIQRETRFLTYMTVNDEEMFLRVMSGALASRFAHHIFFQKPTRDLLERILHREIAKVKGRKAWIKPALDYADQVGIHDPRQVTAICLCGMDDLISGEYQRCLQSCRKGQ